MHDYELTLSDAATALSFLDSSDRDLWVKLGMALRAEFGDSAFDIWDSWSQTADNYKERAARDTWKSFTRSGIGIGTLIKLAMDNGWKPEKKELSDNDKARLRAEQDRRRTERARQAKVEEVRAEKLRDAAAVAARQVWRSLSSVGESPYLVRKHVQGYGLKYPKQGLLIVTDDGDDPAVEVVAGRDNIEAFFAQPEEQRPSHKYLRPGAAIVPMCSEPGGMMENLQILWSGGKKSFLKGGKKQGCFSLLGEVTGECPLVVCEGYATAATIHKATVWPVAIAFDAGNLLPVCEALRRAWQQVPIVVAADDDYKTKGNPGATKARQAAARVNGTLLLPLFAEERPDGATDFNDLQIAQGLDEVRQQLLGYESAPDTEPEQIPAFDDWQIQLNKTATGHIKPNPYNLEMVLTHDKEWQGVLGYSEFSYSILKLKAPPYLNGKVGEWSDTDTTKLRAWCEKKYRFTPGNADASEVVNAVAQDNSFHEVRDYLSGLEWDHKLRLDSWLSTYLGAELTPYTALVGSMWLIAAVARVMRYPVKADCVLILEGNQGVGKSTTAAILGGDWFSDTHFHLGDKDGYQQMRGVWICELAELDSFNKAESTRAKSFFSSTSDRYRPPYGRHVVEFPRQCVFLGTTNQDQYLKDVSGNRRYWPVRVEHVDMEKLREDRDQLWAEALHRFQEGYAWHPSKEQLPLFEAEQDFRFDEDVWTDLIYEHLLNIPKDKPVLMSELFSEALKMDPGHMKPPEQKRIGMIMARLGWRKCRPRTGGGRATGYRAPKDWREEQLGEQSAA